MFVAKASIRPIAATAIAAVLAVTASGAALALHQVECATHQESHEPDECLVCDVIHAAFDSLIAPTAVAALTEPPVRRLAIDRQSDLIVLDGRAPAIPRGPPPDNSCTV